MGSDHEFCAFPHLPGCRLEVSGLCPGPGQGHMGVVRSVEMVCGWRRAADGGNRGQAQDWLPGGYGFRWESGSIYSSLTLSHVSRKRLRWGLGQLKDAGWTLGRGWVLGQLGAVVPPVCLMGLPYTQLVSHPAHLPSMPPQCPRAQYLDLHSAMP